MGNQDVLIETRDRVGLITLNRPEAHNALNNQLVHELLEALEAFDGAPEIDAIVVAGGDKAFAAGADIKEMAALNADEMRSSGFIQAFRPPRVPREAPDCRGLWLGSWRRM